MAKFLRTNEISTKIEDLIQNSRERCVLVSPYLSINEKLKKRIKYKSNLKKPIKIIFKEKTDKLDWLNDLSYIEVGSLEKLHAKCFLNENEAIVTSMNLYTHSQVENYEMGIYVNKENDEELYEDIKEHVNYIIVCTEDFDDFADNTVRERNGTSERSGYCIRCKEKIALNPERPYCKDCYGVWVKFGNDEYQENQCHICGKDMDSTKKKPTCYDCYQEYEDELEFPSS